MTFKYINNNKTEKTIDNENLSKKEDLKSMTASEVVDRFMADEEKRKNKELKLEIAKTIISVPASVIGVKGIYDVPVYFQQKFRTTLDKKEFNKIFQDLKKEGIKEKEITEERIGEKIDLQKIEKMEERIEKMNASEEIKNKLTQELNSLIENYKNEMITLGIGKNEKLTDTLDEYVKTKISGVQAAREGVNTLLTASGAYALRGVSAGIFDSTNRYLNLKKEAKEKDEKVKIFKDFLLGGIRETWREMRLKETKEGDASTKWQKGLKFTKAWGNIARYTGLGAMAKWHPETAGNALDKLMETVTGKAELSDIVDNYQGNIDRLLSFYSGLFKKPLFWFSNNDISKTQIDESGAINVETKDILKSMDNSDTVTDKVNSPTPEIVSKEITYPEKSIIDPEILTARKEAAQGAFESLFKQGKLNEDVREKFINLFVKSDPDDLSGNIKTFIQENSINDSDAIKKEFNDLSEKPAISKGVDPETRRFEQLQAVKDMGRTEIRGLKQNFELVLGKEKVPKSLERVFHMMSVNAMKDVLGADQVFGDEEGAKSLNVAANLVKLAEGKDIAGIKAENLKDVLSWNPKNGALDIKDYSKFNNLVKDLHNHADELWGKGVLKEGAGRYLNDIKKDTWETIVKAKGLEESMGGHDEIVKENISEFAKRENTEAREIKEAMLDKQENIQKHVAGADKVLDGRDKTVKIISQEKLTDRVSGIFKGKLENWGSIKNRSAMDFISGKFMERGEGLNIDQLNSYKDLQNYLKEAQGAIGAPDKESIVDYLHRFEAEKLNSHLDINDRNTIREISEKLKISADKPYFQKAFATMPKDIKLDETKSLGYMKVFAGDKAQVGDGLKELLGLDYPPRAGKGWIKSIDDTITVKNAYGQNRFDILIKDDKIGIDGPEKWNWGTRGGIISEVEPKNKLSIDNIIEAKRIIMSKFGNFGRDKTINTEANIQSATKVNIPLRDAEQHNKEKIPFVNLEKSRKDIPFVDLEKK